MQSILNLAVINFRAKWGDKAYNLERIKGYMTSASKRGAEFIVFPEMCLTGYDDEVNKAKDEKMQVLNAESKNGRIVKELEELAQMYQVYALVGMPEKEECSKNVYNSALVVKLDGTSETYRKIHLALNEPNWATAGDERGLEQEIYMATIDLSLAHRGVFEVNPLIEKTDFKPGIYAKMYAELNQ